MVFRPLIVYVVYEQPLSLLRLVLPERKKVAAVRAWKHCCHLDVFLHFGWFWIEARF
jgi:hypothetical protein